MAVMRSKKLQFVLAMVAWSTVLWLHENYEFVPRRSAGEVQGGAELRGGTLSAARSSSQAGDASVANDVNVGPAFVRKSAFLAGMEPGSTFWMHCSNQRGTCACDGGSSAKAGLARMDAEMTVNRIYFCPYSVP